MVMDTPGPNRAVVDWPAIGNKLFDLLLPAGALRNRFETWNADTRLFLDIAAPELQRVPWELAQSPPPRRRMSARCSRSIACTHRWLQQPRCGIRAGPSGF